MNKYLKEDGTPTTQEDPNRLMFYANCGYYTDDWDNLKKTGSSKMSVGPRGGKLQEVEVGGIPCCPTCHSVGFQTTMLSWLNGAKRYQDDEDHPGYMKFLLEMKEKCQGRQFNFEQSYNWWINKKGPRQG